MSDQWIELEDGYLTNQPIHHYEGRGKNRKPVPDPDVEPTEIYLFCYKASRTPKGRRVKRKRYMKLMTGRNSEELDSKIWAFAARDDVILIPSIERPLQYVRSGAEPERLSREATEGETNE